MTAPALTIVAFLTCMAATSFAQQPPSATQILDEVTVSGPKERERELAPGIPVEADNKVTLRLHESIGVDLRLMKEQTEIVFRRPSAARQLPESRSDLTRVNQGSRLELLPDRLVALQSPWIRDAGYLLAASMDEADGVPAHIPFGPGVALVSLDHVSLRDTQRLTSIALRNAMHPQTRQCKSVFRLIDLWPEGTSPYVLLGKSPRDCNRAMNRREGDLLFAENVPAELRQAVRDLYDPIASRLAHRLGSEPGNLFITWLPDSPHDDYLFQPSWDRSSLLLFNGSDWQQGIDVAQRESLRVAFMREQIKRRIRESDWPGPFTQSAVSYLLLLTRSEEDHTTPQRLSHELPMWIAGCASRLQDRKGAGSSEDVSSLECGLLLQFVYDAVARSRSAGQENIYSTWHKLLDASFHRGVSSATPADFLASSTDARRIAQGLVDGSMDWPQFAAALDDVGVRLNVVSSGALPAMEVESLEHFRN